ncbi:hypothetical protein [Christiangramia sp. OXR-203]|jgi:hypothetical protein|uniref:hypothetical protein n=1 Tax=Christiangramia sp. OXR-203 TaxID=3100176 RepID=UPI002AC96495|nr:hypothetical protein [Christiangramia sp. OXR-203]WPY97662.1 hypothetical protein T8I65_10795 [Christiangramia sp. OXR-203]
MKLTFEKPENGWLPIKFQNEDFRLEFTSSKTPENPIKQFCSNLIQSAKGTDTITIFNTEPELYLFKINQKKNEFNFEIIHHEKPKREVSVYNEKGTFEEIFLPLFRAIKKFSTIDFKSSDWEKIDSHKIEKLDKVIAEEKAIRN